MQRLPAKLATPPAVKTAVKTDVKTSAGVNANNKLTINPNAYGKQAVEGTPDLQGEASKAETKNSFADLFSGLVGNEANKVEGKGEKVEKLPADMAQEVKQEKTAETKLDALLKNKGLDQGVAKSNDPSAMTTDKAMSPEVLQNINNLLTRVPPEDAKSEGMEGLDKKIASTSSNLDQLLKSLRGDKGEVSADAVIDGEEGKAVKDAKNLKAGSPLDFLLKQTKESDVGAVETKDEKLLKSNPEMVSKLGLSSEDFVGHKTSKDGKSLNNKIDLDGKVFDPKEFGQKQLNASMKSYGEKQNLLDNGLIKNTNDLAFKEIKSKASADELKSPDTKIGAELSHVKDSFIPVMNKQEQSTQMESQNAGKVLDLSKMDMANHTEIIKRISDYVQQNQVANSNSLDLTVKHDSLGQFNIQVNRPMDPKSQQMDMQITTSTAEGHDFFVKNEIGLMKNLSQAGIQLSDLRIVSGGESSSFAQNDSRQSGNNHQTPREFMSFENGDHSQGSDRRKELWQEARANQQRYGA